MWRVAKSLLTLRDQVNAAHPDRDKSWDGTIGDAAHASRTSDHNPWVDGGVVTAMDVTHDPAHGVSGDDLAAGLVASRDPRIKYVIWNRRICSSEVSPWVWRPYSGANPHDHHVHISVKPEKSFYDDESPWKFVGTPTVDKRGPVRELQELLNKYGAGLTVDGIYGPKTRSADTEFWNKYK